MKNLLEYFRVTDSQRDIVTVRCNPENGPAEIELEFTIRDACWETVDQPFEPTAQDLAFVRQQLPTPPGGEGKRPTLRIWAHGVSDQDVVSIVDRSGMFAKPIQQLRTTERDLDPEIGSHRATKRECLDIIERFLKLEDEANELTQRVEELTASTTQSEAEPLGDATDEWWDDWSEGPFPLETVMRWREQGAGQFHNSDGMTLDQYLALNAGQNGDGESASQTAEATTDSFHPSLAGRNRRAMSRVSEIIQSIASSLLGWLL